MQVAKFRGTVRYASLSCHIRRETCRKDDIESWLYQQIEVTRGALPWRSLDDKKNEVAMFKVYTHEYLCDSKYKLKYGRSFSGLRSAKIYAN